jgi:hypothetical protein
VATSKKKKNKNSYFFLKKKKLTVAFWLIKFEEIASNSQNEKYAAITTL